MLQYQMDLCRPLLPLIERPIKHRQGKLNDGGIEHDQRVLKSKMLFLRAGYLLASLQQV